MRKDLSGKQTVLLFLFYFLVYVLCIPLFSARIIYPVFMGESYHISVAVCGLLLVTVILLVFLPWFEQEWSVFSRNLKEEIRTIFSYAVFLLIAIILIENILNLFVPGIEPENQTQIGIYMTQAPLFYAVQAIITAPFMEEMLFREAILTPLRRRFSDDAAILVSSLLFGLGHMLLTIQAGNWINLLYLPLYTAIGIFLASVRIRRDSIFSSILLHMIYNTVGVLLMFL